MSHLVKKNSKDVLARCMATEDITVQHSASAETAAFDTKSRTLILPAWENMDNAVYDMLVGHEVSHALHTPMEGWQDFIGDGPGARMRHMFVNVVEDARIERMIKDKFPGLRRDFSSAYKTLHEQDLFELAGRTIDTELPLIDRLNLEFKLGLFGLVQIPFNADEKTYVTRMAETTTFEEVVALAKELYELNKQKQEEQKEENGESEKGSQGQSNDDTGESQDGSQSGSESEEGEESAEGSSAGGEDEDGDESGDSGASMEDDTDDGESAESTTGEDGESGEGEGNQPSNLDYDDYKNDVNCAGSTQNAFEQGVSNLRSENGGSYEYSTLPQVNLDQVVVDYSAIDGAFKKYSTGGDSDRNAKRWERQEHFTELNTYKNSIKGIVAGMVQQFQMKQAADADKRTSIAKTGVLDTNTMINYRWSEDIFVKNEVHTDGKNHGMVMYVDWSGSMSGILQDTVEQLLVLVEFCRKVNLPYEVYAFSSNRFSTFDRYSNEWDEEQENKKEQFTKTDERDCSPHELQLYNFLSSRMNKRDFVTGLQHLWLCMKAGSRYRSASVPACFHLGCTPLNEAIVCALDMVPAFQRANGVQIVNTVFLTDGDGHGMCRYNGYNREDSHQIIDKKTKKSYETNKSMVNRGYNRTGETTALLQMLKDRTGTNLVGIRLHDSKSLRSLSWQFEDVEAYSAAEKQYKKENFITLDSSYDEYFLVKGDLKVEVDAMEELAENSSLTKIRNAFLKGGNRKKASRVIANKMVDIFAA